MRSGFAAAAILALSLAGASNAQQRPRPAAPPPPAPYQEETARPSWAAGVALMPMENSIGLMAIAPRSRDRFCTMELRVLNLTRSTIRSAGVTAEIFFEDTSTITQFSIQFADPWQERRVEIRPVGGCHGMPSRILIREIRACERGTFYPRGCGAFFMQYLPESWRDLDPLYRSFPVIMAHDFDR